MVNNLIARRRTLLKEYGGGTPSGDPWEALFTSINNGTYTTDYAIGDLIPLDLGTEGQINMQIVAFDADTLADGTGTAPVTLISKEPLTTPHRMNPALEGTYGAYTIGTGLIGGWEHCEMRAYLNQTIMPLIPAPIRNHIAPVFKHSRIAETSGSRTDNVQSVDNLWIPGFHEVGDPGSGSYETRSPAYSLIFNTAASRARDYVWGLRTAQGAPTYYTIAAGGSDSSANASTSTRIVLGFCVK